MEEPKVNKEHLLIFEPEYRIWGVHVENKKHGKRLMMGAKFTVICGMIGFIGVIVFISYFIQNNGRF